MIPDDVVETINQARVTLRTAIETLNATPSFLALAGISPSVEATLSEIGKISRLPRLQDPCSGRLSCTFVAAPGPGKLAVLAEMFSQLAERGWLATDEDGPLTQALRIRYAASGSPELSTASLYSWNGAELKTLVDHSQTNHENDCDGDELDLIVYLVSCGQTSGFAELWRSIADACDPAQAEQPAERLIVAVTDTHRYFTDRDIRTRYEDPAIARHIGDHFVATLEENILQRLSPEGPTRPARICFVDSELAVEMAANTPYRAAYERYQKIMANWSEPGKIGHDTLSRLGLMESFAENTAALADPEDRGQGFLLRQILALGRDRGPALLLGKYLVRTGLLPGLGRLLKMLTRHYDPQGRLRQNPAPEPRTDGLLGGNHAENVDAFALRHFDPRIEAIVRQDECRSSEGWAAESFRRMCALLKECMAGHGTTPESAEVFARRLERQVPVWIERWGYAAARLTPNHRGVSNNAELLGHCLKLHAREILHELGETQWKENQLNEIEQDPTDRRRIAALVWDLKQARMTGLALCRRYGVRA